MKWYQSSSSFCSSLTLMGWCLLLSLTTQPASALPPLSPTDNGTASLELVPKADYCYMTTRKNRYNCDSIACGGAPYDGKNGWCEYNRGSKTCRSHRMASGWKRAACESCICKGGYDGRYKAPNRNSKHVYDSGYLNSYASSLTGLSGADATLSQYKAWHSVEDLANPLADWSENGDWAFGEKDGVYKRDGKRNSTGVLAKGKWRVTNDQITGLEKRDDLTTYVLDGDIVLASNQTGGTLLLTDAEASVDEDGRPARLSYIVKAASNDTASLTKRDDWSQINFQFWAADGARNADPYWQDFHDNYAGIINALDNGRTRGGCFSVIDDAAFWATVKIWTGNTGYGDLGDCQCSSSDYSGIMGSECGGSDV
ncbi:hypothetical protein I302_106999 [Kwoniella bestiolae CBS 10118]|uniref:Uncharacterized protein n=1 Tax=Kwoniella bestiolae CBS 10118 TaxID=1296100 RepID=A0A1B9FZT8_9TREE|nr:hypothetical protein I302_05739 [Kwoniella bestiolae CBS 10118]OCF24280.1 hypothetical protein I302_05739 [Kwoniella bestiolae CBS 10118]